ncbi:hypothetical protein C8T65DRAFT_651390 [Cerioporus squamosus]|nr:hypothetical protein C8T65DRAFT_651390 [Cerioporus squamosus]
MMFTYIGTDLDATPVSILHDSFFIQICCSAASTTFLIHEYIVTFDKEVEYFWVKRPNCGSFFFLFSRYIPLVIKAIDMCGYIHMSDKPLFYLSCATFTSLRAWALSGRNRAFTVFIALLCLAPTVAFRWVQVRNDPTFGCMNGSTIPVTLASGLLTAGRGPVILADLLVIALTWYTAYKAGVLWQTAHWLRPSFWRTFTRDGRAILTMNVLRLCFALRVITPVDVNPACYVILFTEPVTAVLICRFLINVQEVNKQTILGHDTWLVDASLQPHTATNLRFANVRISSVSRPRFDGRLGHTANITASSESRRELPAVQ